MIKPQNGHILCDRTSRASGISVVPTFPNLSVMNASCLRSRLRSGRKTGSIDPPPLFLPRRGGPATQLQDCSENCSRLTSPAGSGWQGHANDSVQECSHSTRTFRWHCAPPTNQRLNQGLIATFTTPSDRLRRHEAVALTLDHLQQREEHWAIVDLVGKGGHIRRVPVPDWVRAELDDWLAAAAIDRGRLFRRVNKVGRTWGDGMTVKAVWHIVKESARSIGVAKLAPHDLRRTCARLCHASGGELEQIQFLLGHVSVQTTERYLGCKQRIRSAVNDRIGIEPNP